MTDRRFSFAPTQQALRRLRAEVRAAAAGLGAPTAVCERVTLVVDELVNNAIEHGARYRRLGLDLAVRVGSAAGRLSVEFVDPEMPEANVRELAVALADAGSGMPSLDSERGRGLFLLSIFLEELHAEVHAGGGLRLRGVVAGD